MYLSRAMKPIVVGKLFGRLYKTGPFEWPPALWDGRINELCASYTFSNGSRTTRSGKGQMKLQKKREEIAIQVILSGKCIVLKRSRAFLNEIPFCWLHPWKSWKKRRLYNVTFVYREIIDSKVDFTFFLASPNVFI